MAVNVVVTGATGCLGGATVRRFLAAGARVTATGRNRTIGAGLAASGARFEAADLCDATAIDRLVAGHDTVVHCGGLSSPWGSPGAFHRANVEGTRNVVEAAERHGVRRLVFLSTPSLYFDYTDRLEIGEGEPLARRPINAYAASKLEAERVVAAAARRGLDAVVLRPRAIFGPGDTALLPRLLRVATRGWLPLIDEGRAVIDLTYVDNAADAVVAAAEAPGYAAGRVYNITNGEPCTVLALFEQIIAALGLRVRLVHVPFPLAYLGAATLEALTVLVPGRPEPPLTRYTLGMIARSQTLSIDAARRDLGYHPHVSLADGIRTTLDRARLGP